jgi:hypothetical protein
MTKDTRVNDMKNSREYIAFLNELKASVKDAMHCWILNGNQEEEMLRLRLHTGKKLLDKAGEGWWDSSCVVHLADDLTSAFPEYKLFAVDDLRRMRTFAGCFTEDDLDNKWLCSLPWSHWKSLLCEFTDRKIISWYAYRCFHKNSFLEELAEAIHKHAHAREFSLVINLKD